MNGPGAPYERLDDLHLRRITMRGYRLANDLFEIEGHIIDTKPVDFAPASGDYRVPADEPIHDMGLSLIFGSDMVVRDVRTFTRATPYEMCPAAASAMRAIIGLQIGRGWNKEVQRRLPPASRCTHLAELLGPMATAALQAMSGLRQDRPDPVDAQGRPLQLGTCFAYSPHSDLVKRRWPDFYEPVSQQAEIDER
ncbi:DUF2889 domain-containing protein [Novosphingobium rosa]|uniref:DUF2889 domain-containing protein n=1 Tax=Novosphingobium rosa TaxID=76978 RepID=UPI00082DD4B7|nr:DUF2889 domain-containing protein [Novosphingobium rosa]